MMTPQLVGTTDLAWMRSLQERAMPNTIVIESRTLAADGAGGYTETWAASGTVSGRMAPRVLNAGEPVVGGQPASQSYWFATLPHGTTVTERDRLVADGRSFEVVRVNTSEDYQTAVRCECIAYNQERRA